MIEGGAGGLDIVQLTVRKDLFERMQRLAVPLIDDFDSILEKLIVNWEEAHQASVERTSRNADTKYLVTGRGDRLPVGAELRASYTPRQSGKTWDFVARVGERGIEFDNKVFRDPSPAGEHAKRLAGAKGNATRTNGRRFWKVLDQRTDTWVRIEDVAGGQDDDPPIDLSALFD